MAKPDIVVVNPYLGKKTTYGGGGSTTVEEIPKVAPPPPSPKVTVTSSEPKTQTAEQAYQLRLKQQRVVERLGQQQRAKAILSGADPSQISHVMAVRGAPTLKPGTQLYTVTEGPAKGMVVSEGFAGKLRDIPVEKPEPVQLGTFSATPTQPRSVLIPEDQKVKTFQDPAGQVVGIEDPVAQVSMAVKPQSKTQVRELEQKRATAIVQAHEIKRGKLPEKQAVIDVPQSLVPGFTEKKRELLGNVQSWREKSQDLWKRAGVLTDLGQKMMREAPEGQSSFEGLGYSLKGVATEAYAGIIRAGVGGAELIGRFDELPVFMLKAPYDIGRALLHPRKTAGTIKETLRQDPGAAVEFGIQLGILGKAHSGLVELVKPAPEVKVSSRGKTLILETERAAYGKVGKWNRPTITEITPLEPTFTFGKGWVFAEGDPVTVLSAGEFVYVPPGVSGPVVQVGDVKLGIQPQELGQFMEVGNIKVIEGPPGDIPKIRVGEYSRRGFVQDPGVEPALAGLDTRVKLRTPGKSVTDAEYFRKLEQGEFRRPTEGISQWKRISGDLSAEGISADLWRVELPGQRLSASSFYEEAGLLDKKSLQRIKKFDYGTDLNLMVKEKPFIESGWAKFEDYSAWAPKKPKPVGMSDFKPVEVKGVSSSRISPEGLRTFQEYWRSKDSTVSPSQSRALTDMAQNLAQRSPGVDFAAELGLSDKSFSATWPLTSYSSRSSSRLRDLSAESQSIGARLLPTQRIRPTQDLRPMQNLRPIQNLRPSQDLRPTQDLRPMQNLRPMQELRPMQDLRPIQDLRPMQDFRPGRGPPLELMRFAPPWTPRFIPPPPPTTRRGWTPFTPPQKRGYFERIFRISDPERALGIKKSRRRKRKR